MTWRKRLLAYLGLGSTGSLTSCILQAPGALEATPGAWANLWSGAARLRGVVEPMLTGATISGAAALAGFGGAALLVAQPYLVRRFPRLAGWLPRADADMPARVPAAAPTLAARLDGPALTDLTDRLSRVEVALREQGTDISTVKDQQDKAAVSANRVMELIAGLTDTSSKNLTLHNLATARMDRIEETIDKTKLSVNSVDDTLNKLISVENRRRLRNGLDGFAKDMAIARVSLEAKEGGSETNELDNLREAQNRLIGVSASLERLFGLNDVVVRMNEKSYEVSDEVRRGQIPENASLRTSLQRQYNLLDGVIGQCYGMVDSGDYKDYQWLSGWQRREPQRRDQAGQA